MLYGQLSRSTYRKWVWILKTVHRAWNSRPVKSGIKTKNQAWPLIFYPNINDFQVENVSKTNWFAPLARASRPGIGARERINIVHHNGIANPSDTSQLSKIKCSDSVRDALKLASYCTCENRGFSMICMVSGQLFGKIAIFLVFFSSQTSGNYSK